MEHLEQLIWSNRIKNAVHVRFCYCNDEKIITYQKKKKRISIAFGFEFGKKCTYYIDKNPFFVW